MNQPKIHPSELAERIRDGRGFKISDLADYGKDDLGESIRLLTHFEERLKLEKKLLTQERDRLRGTASATV